MNQDDGRGPYIFCKRGLSHCEDQHCECVDTSKYRAMYYLSRERRGWTLGPYPAKMALYLVACAIVGAATGLLLATAIVKIGGVLR